MQRPDDLQRKASISVSPYEAELSRGPVALRFPPSLEREYSRFRLQLILPRAKLWLWVLFTLTMSASVYRLGFDGRFGFNVETVLRLAVLTTACVAMLFAAYHSRYEQVYPRIALAGSALYGVALAVLVMQIIVEGGAETLSILTMHTLAVYFLLGLMFLPALGVSLLMLGAFIGAGLAYGQTPGMLAYTTALLVAVAGIGAYIAWGVDESARRLFLERGALGELAERDGLTGLRNRRAFDDHLLRVWQQSLRDRSTIAVLLIDLDHFKPYNDFYGHQAGDACLRYIAQIVQRHARRPLDMAARYGGEEMAIVLFQVTPDHARAIAEQLRAAIDTARIEHRAAPGTGRMTASVGGAWIEATLERTPDDLVQLADEALYAAKQAGRNTVRFLGPEHSNAFTGTMRRLPADWVGPGAAG
jgi:diguanylate cyclase (GGDEF)-like protein